MAGIYLHIPFCKQACTYCDFHFSTTFDKYRGELVVSIKKELEERVVYLKAQPIESIYFGGGTPSLLEKVELKELLSTIYSRFDVKKNVEITLEANPDDISEIKLKSWKSAGINRLSIGLQSFLQDDLDWMNRAHTAEESVSAVKLAKNFGFALTVDLIYGLPNRNIHDWEDNINKLITLDPEHISAYCLTIENNTILKHKVTKGEIIPATEAEQASQFMLLLSLLKKARYEQYEISNFCKRDKYSRHNSNYWKGVHYLGVGPSAHSFDGETRRWNVANNQKYIKGIDTKADYFEVETLSNKDKFNELIMTGLRTVWGVDLKALKQFDLSSEDFENQIALFKDAGLLVQDKNTISLTDKGRLQADYIASQLFVI
ncbi:MAG: radical SAM family heme chaperone HemW [Brumimicrobium sp.]